MANNEQFQARFRAAMRDAARKFLAEEELPEPVAGEAKFTTIETLALAAGDAVSLEVFEQQFEQQREQSDGEPPRCPHCQAAGQRVGERDRTLTTRRGLDVPLAEQECYCPGCRRAFFPSVQGVGAGRGL